MAIYHLTVKTGSRSGGQSALAKSQYIQRQGRYRADRAEVLHTQSGNMPDWALADPSAYWDAADLYERANGRLFREVEFALPIELTLDQQRKLADEFARHLTDGERLPYTLAIHAGGGTNPHCHLLISERRNDGIDRPPEQWFRRYNAKRPERGGAQKTASLKPKAWLEQTREAWSRYANRALEQSGHEARIDHRSHEERGIERLPGIHLGPNVVEMESRGISTDRADAALSIEAANDQITDLQNYREVVEHAGIGQGEEGEERGGTRRADRAVGSEHCQSDGEIAPGGTAAFVSGGRFGKTGTGGSQRRGGGSEGHQERIRCRTGGDQWNYLEVVGWGAFGVRDAYCSPADRISGLAGLEDTGNGGRGKMAADRTAVNDRTLQAVTRQIEAMRCANYEIGIREQSSGRMMNRTVRHRDIARMVPWLKMMNARGNDIYIRPARNENHALILVDDLTSNQVDAMAAAGHEPSIVVETSPENYQAWVRVSSEPVDIEARGEIARYLAREYEADIASADAVHYGRLAGFTNQKPKYKTARGYQPWVLCRLAVSRIASAGSALVQMAINALKRRSGERQDQEALSDATGGALRTGNAVDVYARLIGGLIDKYNGDISRADFAAATILASDGWDEASIVRAIEGASPDVDARKRGHVRDYAERTARKAWEAAQAKYTGPGM